MTRAYTEQYLNDAMRNLGEAFDYAVNACKLSPDEFMQLFIASGFAEKFGKGNPKIVSGLSGTELVIEIITKSGRTISFPESQIDYDCSPEYWCGFVLAYYQWVTARSFRNIHENISMQEVLKLYPTHHEASEDKFVDTVNAIIARKAKITRLQRQRKRCCYSQSELAKKSGISLRTLQHYEIGTKSINKASVQTIVALASVLGCKVEDLLEATTEDED